MTIFIDLNLKLYIYGESVAVNRVVEKFYLSKWNKKIQMLMIVHVYVYGRMMTTYSHQSTNTTL